MRVLKSDLNKVRPCNQCEYEYKKINKEPCNQCIDILVNEFDFREFLKDDI